MRVLIAVNHEANLWRTILDTETPCFLKAALAISKPVALTESPMIPGVTVTVKSFIAAAFFSRLLLGHKSV